ncbi:MAG: (deoxy)nucleoside triphosphate pyrophosphohydrolase [Erysipelotrichaceae bacterium]|nr:(deoxy)nucleoside triphosphate pyrophosphohydrolase [Erysipelotrichaceae bacterium]MDD3924536.1 (deoxy)nucleoside triphosphate pyrophosphohydrolase [Erysipelotrichaceae bacterium]
MKTVNVVAAIIIDNGRILASQRASGQFKDGWEFPGGKIELNESKEEALIREIKEELNIDIQVGECLCDIEYDYSNFRLEMSCFISNIKNGEIELLEHKAIKWLTNDELNSVNWLEADTLVVQHLKDYILQKGM